MKYEFNGKIRYSEVGENARLTLNGLVNYFQDTSTFQSEYLKVGIEYLKEHHLAWILSSWQIVIHRLPKLCEQVTVQTWAYEFKGFYGMRNFALLDEQGELTARANSVWVLFDTQQQRPVRITPEIGDCYGAEPRLEMEYAPRKISVPKEGTTEEPILVGKHHLDTNHHVNNGQYITWAQDYLPEGFHIHQMRADYRMQARLHDEITPIVSRLEDQVTVQLCDRERKPYAVVEFSAGENISGRELC